MSERLHYFNEATTVVSFDCSDSDIDSDVDDPRRPLNASDRAKQHALQLQLWSDEARRVRGRRRTLPSNQSRGCPSDRQQSNLSCSPEQQQNQHRSSSVGRSRSHSSKNLRIRVTPSSSSRSLLSDISTEGNNNHNGHGNGHGLSPTPSGGGVLPMLMLGNNEYDGALQQPSDEYYHLNGNGHGHGHRHGHGRRPVRVQNGPGPRCLPPMEYDNDNENEEQEYEHEKETDLDKEHLQVQDQVYDNNLHMSVHVAEGRHGEQQQQKKHTTASKDNDSYSKKKISVVEKKMECGNVSSACGHVGYSSTPVMHDALKSMNHARSLPLQPVRTMDANTTLKKASHQSANTFEHRVGGVLSLNGNSGTPNNGKVAKHQRHKSLQDIGSHHHHQRPDHQSHQQQQGQSHPFSLLRSRRARSTAAPENSNSGGTGAGNGGQLARRMSFNRNSNRSGRRSLFGRLFRRC